ncbi:MAG: cytochrome c peroxidase [Sulfurospirillaceae bacterium]|nr:cytochrome c peroxidase [Sulfurospirillaceae bacterium]
MNYFIFFGISLLFYTLTFAEPITPIPLTNSGINTQKAKLGKKLFFDKILSKDDSTSCADCHKPSHSGADNLRASFGVYHNKTNLNTSTVYNSRYNFVQFFDGRAKNLEEASKYCIESNTTMDSVSSDLIKKLNNSSYKKDFSRIYNDKIKQKYIDNAIAEYMKSLVTPNSAFDRYLRGDKSALSKSQKRGYSLFKLEGCIICHNGINVGSNLFAKFGEAREAPNSYLGKYNVSKASFDKYFLKVPTLRNISKTAPYLHDGRFDNLSDVVKFMLKYQLDKSVSQKDVNDIVAFLKSLDGETPKNAK